MVFVPWHIDESVISSKSISIYVLAKFDRLCKQTKTLKNVNNKGNIYFLYSSGVNHGNVNPHVYTSASYFVVIINHVWQLRTDIIVCTINPKQIYVVQYHLKVQGAPRIWIIIFLNDHHFQQWPIKFYLSMVFLFKTCIVIYSINLDTYLLDRLQKVSYMYHLCF